MIQQIKNLILKIRIGVYHAAYHRNMKRAQAAKDNSDLKKFQESIYRAEDAWRKLITLIVKQQQE